MSVNGKSINLFLIDGVASGRIKGTLANWTGLSYKIPRTAVRSSKDIDYLNQTGVYFLFGVDEESGRDLVYIGQAGLRKNGQAVLGRLSEHIADKDMDYWTEAVIFTTSNDSFGPTDISYLENQFHELALNANRYEIRNNQDPNQGNITEEKQSELNEFITNAKLMMGTLGHNVFDPVRQVQPVNEPVDNFDDDDDLYYLKTARAEATGQVTSEGFVVFAGSRISLVETASIPKGYQRLRREHWGDVSDEGVLMKDILFTSPSAAASFVGGTALGGYAAWKDMTESPLWEDTSGNVLDYSLEDILGEGV